MNTLELGVGVGLTLRSSGLELTGFEQKLDFGVGGLGAVLVCGGAGPRVDGSALEPGLGCPCLWA